MAAVVNNPLQSNLTKEQLDYLERRYTTASLPGAYSPPRKFYKQLKLEGKYNFSLKQISDWLTNVKGYYFHKQIRRPKKQIPVFSPYPGFMVEADLLSYQSLKKSNKFKQYVLVVIDQCSRKAFGRAITTKSADNIVSALKAIFSSAKFVPENLMVDQGTEFKNHIVQKFCSDKGIDLLFSTNSATSKSSLAERFILTFRILMARILTQKDTRVWVKFLPSVLKNYNASPHSSLKGITPNAAWSMSPAELHMRVYREKTKTKTKIEKKQLKTPKKKIYFSPQ